MTRCLALAAALLAVLVFPGLATAALTPAQIHAAYDLPERSAKPRTIALVLAYDAPTLAKDLATYTRRFRLPSCTVRSGCFRKVNQAGAAAPLPRPDPTGGNWVGEAVLGTQVARAVCQNCRILVVETNSDVPTDLAAGIATAVRMGARVIATQYLLPDDPGTRGGYAHPGVVITAATGDNGYTQSIFAPAAFPDVVAVGGTRLRTRGGGRYDGETVWSQGSFGKATSGCGPFTPAPLWQVREALAVGCGAQRSVADISAVAAPGAAVYSSTPVVGETGWIEEGGTSLASPLIAATFALAGGVPRGVSAPRLLYQNFHARRGGLRDIVAGANGACGRAICEARKGYDGPTGIGTPKGLKAFRSYRR